MQVDPQDLKKMAVGDWFHVWPHDEEYTTAPERAYRFGKSVGRKFSRKTVRKRGETVRVVKRVN